MKSVIFVIFIFAILGIGIIAAFKKAKSYMDKPPEKDDETHA